MHHEAVVETRNDLQRGRGGRGLTLTLLGSTSGRLGGRRLQGGLIRWVDENTLFVAPEAQSLDFVFIVDERAITSVLIVPNGLDILDTLTVLRYFQHLLCDLLLAPAYLELDDTSCLVSFVLFAGRFVCCPHGQHMPSAVFLIWSALKYVVLD